MKSLNKVQLIGRLGKDPDMKFTPSGRQVTAFSLAMNREWKTAEGERQSQTEWTNIEFWGKAAEIVTQYASKGQLMYVEGRLQTDRVPGRDGGADKFFTKVVGQEFMFLGGNRDGERVEADPAEEPAVVPAEDDIPF